MAVSPSRDTEGYEFATLDASRRRLLSGDEGRWDQARPNNAVRARLPAYCPPASYITLMKPPTCFSHIL